MFNQKRCFTFLSLCARKKTQSISKKCKQWHYFAIQFIERATIGKISGSNFPSIGFVVISLRKHRNFSVFYRLIQKCPSGENDGAHLLSCLKVIAIVFVAITILLSLLLSALPLFLDMFVQGAVIQSHMSNAIVIYNHLHTVFFFFIFHCRSMYLYLSLPFF